MMYINILTKDVSLTHEEETAIHNKLYFALYANERSIGTVEVSICAIPCFEAECLHHCRIEIHLTNGNVIIGDCCESDINVTIDQAINRSCPKVSASIESRLQSYTQNRWRQVRGCRSGGSNFLYGEV